MEDFEPQTLNLNTVTFGDPSKVFELEESIGILEQGDKTGKSVSLLWLYRMRIGNSLE